MLLWWYQCYQYITLKWYQCYRYITLKWYQCYQYITLKWSCRVSDRNWKKISRSSAQMRRSWKTRVASWANNWATLSLLTITDSWACRSPCITCTGLTKSTIKHACFNTKYTSTYALYSSWYIYTLVHAYMYNRNKIIDNRTHLFDMVSYCMHVWVFYIRKCGVYYNKLFISTSSPQCARSYCITSNDHCYSKIKPEKVILTEFFTFDRSRRLKV